MSRTFRTVGSGASQTTEPIENNKIPVYETKAAAEADIANLSDGQIIGTKDEGNEYAKPVDVVEKGNLHAVTSNAVANAVSYSTQEVKTGGTWIDGKPIYRKVIIYTYPESISGLVSISHNIQNIETPIRVVFGIAKVPGGNNGITIPAQYDSDTFIQLGSFSSEAVQLFTGSKNWTPMRDITLCLEYTKTTD